MKTDKKRLKVPQYHVRVSLNSKKIIATVSALNDLDIDEAADYLIESGAKALKK